MTDAEIIKALECCREGDCKNCTFDECTTGLLDEGIALSLINRQKAEIDEQYEIAEANVRAEIASGGTSCHWCADKMRAEAIKEFAERLKAKFDQYGVDYTAYAIVDDVVKEMGGNDG